LRNPEIPIIAGKLRQTGHEVFDDWFAAGPNADDHWRDYEKQRGRTYVEGLQGLAARHVFAFDRFHLERADIAVLALPSGRSCHLEMGWHLRSGKPGYVLIDDPERWDCMYQFATGVFTNINALIDHLPLPLEDQ
jgi:hypothetical protein